LQLSPPFPYSRVCASPWSRYSRSRSTHGPAAARRERENVAINAEVIGNNGRPELANAGRLERSNLLLNPFYVSDDHDTLRV